MTEPYAPQLETNSPPSDSESELVRKAKEDPLAFEQIYTRYVQPIYKYFYNRTWNELEAEDLTAQTFVSALENIQKYHDNGHFQAWLFSIARNKAIDHFRKNKALNTFEIPEDIPVNSDFLTDSIESERRKAIFFLFRSLPEKEKELLRLRYVAELSFASIGKLLHRSEGSVKKAIYRIVQRMKVELEEKYG